MPVPRNIDEDFEILPGGQIEKPFGWDLVNPDDVCAELTDLGEVGSCLLGRSKQLSGGVGGKRAVANAFNAKFLFAEPKKFAIDAYACKGGSLLRH